MKTAIITGASGQDAYYLSNLLLEKNYKVVAISRRSGRPQSESVIELSKNPNYEIVEGDITDVSSIIRAIKIAQPDEFYNLAAQSEVGTSFNQPLTTVDITGMGVANCLEAVRETKPNTRFYQAGSSEQFGDTHGDKPLNEESAMEPRSPYAAAKLMGHHLARIYRNSYDMFVSCGILFNHESPHRKPYFVTRKITQGVARIKYGIQKDIELGNLNSGRDWGHAKDYMRAAWMMLQADKPNDYVVSMGTFHTIEELLEIAFDEAGLKNWKSYVTQNPKYMRPHDVTRLIGDSSKIKSDLGWEPEYSFEQMIREMVRKDSDDIIRSSNITNSFSNN